MLAAAQFGGATFLLVGGFSGRNNGRHAGGNRGDVRALRFLKAALPRFLSIAPLSELIGDRVHESQLWHESFKCAAFRQTIPGDDLVKCLLISIL